MENVIDYYDYESWQNSLIDNLKIQYKLSELEALNVLEVQKNLVNQLFDDFNQGKAQPMTQQLELLMDNDLENDCWN